MYRFLCLMRALYFEAFGGPLTVRDLPAPGPAPDGVVVEVAASGICRSDWHGWQGHDPDVALPHVPGHELAGSVAAVGTGVRPRSRSEEHTSELQSHVNLVCRLLLEKKKKITE